MEIVETHPPTVLPRIISALLLWSVNSTLGMAPSGGGIQLPHNRTLGKGRRLLWGQCRLPHRPGRKGNPGQSVSQLSAPSTEPGHRIPGTWNWQSIQSCSCEGKVVPVMRQIRTKAELYQEADKLRLQLALPPFCKSEQAYARILEQPQIQVAFLSFQTPGLQWQYVHLVKMGRRISFSYPINSTAGSVGFMRCMNGFTCAGIALLANRPFYVGNTAFPSEIGFLGSGRPMKVLLKL